MRSLAALVLASLVLATSPTAHAAEAGPQVRIAELLASPDATQGQREFVELWNAGASDVDLQGWRLRDAPTASNNTNEYAFGALALAAGQRIVVWSNGSADAAGPAWSTSASKAVWNDAGDAATLLDPQGTVRDWVGYGSTSQGAPAGFSSSKPAAPPKGKSIQLEDGQWVTADPTPGLARGQQGGAITARVVNVAPRATLQAPASVRAGAAALVHVEVADDNGVQDIVAWTLSSGGESLRQGNASTAGDVPLTAPRQGPWTLTLTVRDAGGLAGNATATVQVRQLHISVALPAGGSLHFPDLRPGDHNVTSVDALTLRNDGDDLAVPVIDVSGLRAGAARIDVERNLWLGSTKDGQTTWTRYDAPLQPLPALAPGETATLGLRIGDVPLPAAAGVYGTTFTVVAT